MQNKSKNTILLVIIIILLVIGLVYVLLNKTEKIEVNNSPQKNKIEDTSYENSSERIVTPTDSITQENVKTPLYIKSIYKKDGRWWADVDYVTKVTPLEHMTKKINDGSCVIPGMTKSEMLTYAKNTVKNHVEQDNLLVVNCDYDWQRIYATIGVHPYFINLNPLIRSFSFIDNFNGFQKFNEVCKGKSLQTPEMIKGDIELQIEEKTINQYYFDTYETKGYFQDSVIIENGKIKKFDGDPSCPN